MINTEDQCFTLLDISYYQKMDENNIKNKLENGTVEQKREALKEVIVSTANGEVNKAYLILIIRYILHMEDHTIKKLLLIFWELYPKTDSHGELIPEMILVCDAFRKDLHHSNEFVTGSTLRYLCKLKQPDILIPLIDSIRDCLNNKSPYVRRNAVLTIYSIYKFFNNLIPDAPELVEDFLNNERDTRCKRNAFVMLLNTDIDKAVNYLLSSLDYISNFDHSLQLVIIELIQKICKKNSPEKSGFIRCVYTLLDSKNNAVRYEAAKSLTMITSTPSALKATLNTYIDLILKADDDITKLIIIDQLIQMKYNSQHIRVLQESVFSILCIIPKNKDIKLKIEIIKLILELMTDSNVNHIIKVLKKESLNDKISDNKYKMFLAQKLYACFQNHPHMSTDIITFFNRLLTIETDEEMLLNILTLLRQGAYHYKSISPFVVNKLKEKLNLINSLEVYCKALWIITELNQNEKHNEDVINENYQMIQEVMYHLNKNDIKHKDATNRNGTISNYVKVINDKSLTKQVIDDIFKNTGFFSVSIASCLSKLALDYKNADLKNIIINKAIYTVTVLFNLNKCGKNYDTCFKLQHCLVILLKPDFNIFEQIKIENKLILDDFFKSQIKDNNEIESGHLKLVQPDEPICFLQIHKNFKDFDVEDLEILDNLNDIDNHSLKKIVQLTGLSDPIYSEARLVHTSEQYITMLIMLINRTDETVQNCSVELTSTGDILILDKPKPKTIEPNGKIEIKVNIKVSLVGNSIIYGNIVYDTTKIPEHSTIVLSDIPINVIDYIKPCDCDQADFCKMWREFEWENKIYISTKEMINLNQFLNLVCKSVRMKCVTPRESMEGDCYLLTANLFGESIFGEKVIANLSVENNEVGKIIGHVRLRARSQGIVMSLGDVIRSLKC